MRKLFYRFEFVLQRLADLNLSAKVTMVTGELFFQKPDSSRNVTGDLRELRLTNPDQGLLVVDQRKQFIIPFTSTTSFKSARAKLICRNPKDSALGQEVTLNLFFGRVAGSTGFAPTFFFLKCDQVELNDVRLAKPGGWSSLGCTEKRVRCHAEAPTSLIFGAGSSPQLRFHWLEPPMFRVRRWRRRDFNLWIIQNWGMNDRTKLVSSEIDD